jgi:CheY-like chemotaxis protein
MRVLIVDDSLIVRQMLQGVVQDLGHECLVGRDGDEGMIPAVGSATG